MFAAFFITNFLENDFADARAPPTAWASRIRGEQFVTRDGQGNWLDKSNLCGSYSSAGVQNGARCAASCGEFHSMGGQFLWTDSAGTCPCNLFGQAPRKRKLRALMKDCQPRIGFWGMSGASSAAGLRPLAESFSRARDVEEAMRSQRHKHGFESAPNPRRTAISSASFYFGTSAGPTGVCCAWGETLSRTMLSCTTEQLAP